MIANQFTGGVYRLQSGEKSILVDSDNNRLKADVYLHTTAGEDVLKSAEEGVANEIGFPGEYEIQGIEIMGVGVPEESDAKTLKTCYLITWEEMKFVFLGGIHNHPAPNVLEELDEPDVLFMNLGAKGFDAEAAAKIIKEMAPKLVFVGEGKPAAELAKLLGEKPDAEDKFVFKAKDLAVGKSRVVVLKENA